MARERSRGRKSENPRGSTLINGELIDTGTQQKLFFATHCCSISGYELKPGETLLQAEATKFMNRIMKKRYAHSTVSVLEKRLAFEAAKEKGKNPLRLWVGYDEILGAYQSKTKPEFFVLSIQARSGKNYYDCYKCKNKADTDKLLDFIQRARADPEYTIRDLQAIDHMEIQDDPNRTRSVGYFETQTSQDSLSGSEKSLKSPAHSSHSLLLKEAAPLQRRYSSPSPTLATMSDISHLQNVTYIKFDPVRGAMESDSGPVYMYMERFPSARHDSSSSQSDSDDVN